MPLQTCTEDGKPGYRWGLSGKCFTYPSGDDAARREAKRKAILQGVAIEGGSVQMAEWSTALINTFPDSSFLYVAPGGSKDSEGKTVPRSLRFFPVKDASGKVDIAHVRNALARIPQSNVSQAVKDKAIAAAQRMLAAAGGSPSGMAEEDLETVDIPGISVMAVGGPYHGSNSPPEGDFFTVEDLAVIAAATNEVTDELRPPVKIGHSNEQALAKASGFVATDEAPALGWLSNFHVEGDQLKADAEKVPRKFARFLKAGTFRTRSAETSPYQSPTTSKAYDTVVRGLAFLGARAPAMKNLDDLVVAFGDEEVEEGVNTYDFIEPVGATLNVVLMLGDNLGESRDTRSVADTPIVEDGAVVEVKLTDEQAKEFAKLFGLDEFDIDALTEKVKELQAKETPTPPEPKPDEPPPPEEDPNAVKLSRETFDELQRDAAAGREAKRRLDEAERDTVIESAIKDFKLDPADRKEFAERYEADPGGTKWFIEKLPVRDDLVKVYGEDSDGMTPEDRESSEDAEYRRYLEATGRDPEQDPTLRKAS